MASTFSSASEAELLPHKSETDLAPLVTAEYPIEFRFRSRGEFELVFLLARPIRLSPELRSGCANDPGLLVGKVAAYLAAACGYNPFVDPTPEMIEAGSRAILAELDFDPVMSPSLAETLAARVLRDALQSLRSKTEASQPLGHLPQSSDL